MKDTSDSCPCGSTKNFYDCCEPLLRDHAIAQTPIVLMRSRYTAYVLKNVGYLLQTWAPLTRPAPFDLDHEQITWLGLTIHGDRVDDNSGEVRFSAEFIEGDERCTMHENSRFVRQHGLWYYQDGSNHIERTPIARNGPCPCGSGRKYKRCCRLK